MGWLGGGKDLSLAELIARKQYKKALDLLEAEFQKGGRSPRLRLQFADVLTMAGRGKEALPILLGLADEFARDGFAAKAIAVLKKAEKIQPGDPAIERRLAGLIHEKQREVSITATGSFVMPPPVSEPNEVSAELEIGLGAAPASAPVPVPAPQPVSPPAPAEETEFASAEEFEDLGNELTNLLNQSLEAEPAQPEAPVSIPLFGDFSPEELTEIIHGLRLLSFEPGDVIISQGQTGNSLFVLTTGTVKAWVRGGEGPAVRVRIMREGDFFGEISLLSGQPRTATVTAATRCELLELDRPTLEDIHKRRPRVLEVLREFYRQRLNSPEEARAKGASS